MNFSKRGRATRGARTACASLFVVAPLALSLGGCGSVPPATPATPASSASAATSTARDVQDEMCQLSHDLQFGTASASPSSESNADQTDLTQVSALLLRPTFRKIAGLSHSGAGAAPASGQPVAGLGAWANQWMGAEDHRLETERLLAKSKQVTSELVDECISHPRHGYCKDLFVIFSSHTKGSELTPDKAFQLADRLIQLCANREPTAENAKVRSLLNRCATNVSALATAGRGNAAGKAPEYPDDKPWKAALVGCRKNTERSDSWVAAPGSSVRSQTFVVTGTGIVPEHTSFGSGFPMVYRHGGRTIPFVVTNHHVIQNLQGIRVLREDGTVVGSADVWVSDSVVDLALLRVRGAQFEGGLVPAPEAASDLLPVVASGFPSLGGTPSYQITKGSVSNSRIFDGLYLQHTAPIDPGSSGGPLVDTEGRLVGVNTSIALGRQGAGFARPTTAIGWLLREGLRIDAQPSRKDELARATCLQTVGHLRSVGAEGSVSRDYLATRLSRDLVGRTNLIRGEETGEPPTPRTRREMLAYAAAAQASGLGALSTVEPCTQMSKREGKWLETLHGKNGTLVLRFSWESGEVVLDDSELRRDATPRTR